MAKGNVEYGYQLGPDSKHLEPNPAEQAALADIRALCAQRLSMRAIAAELNERGHTTRRGTNWRLESVARVLKTIKPHLKLAA